MFRPELAADDDEEATDDPNLYKREIVCTLIFSLNFTFEMCFSNQFHLFLGIAYALEYKKHKLKKITSPYLVNFACRQWYKPFVYT